MGLAGQLQLPAGERWWEVGGWVKGLKTGVKLVNERCPLPFYVAKQVGYWDLHGNSLRGTWREPQGKYPYGNPFGGKGSTPCITVSKGLSQKVYILPSRICFLLLLSWDFESFLDGSAGAGAALMVGCATGAGAGVLVW